MYKIKNKKLYKKRSQKPITIEYIYSPSENAEERASRAFDILFEATLKRYYFEKPSKNEH